MGKKEERPKNQVKVVKNEKNLVKNLYCMHWGPKKYTKKYKMSVIQNKEDMISYYQLKRNWKKKYERPKNQVKVVKK